MVATEKTRFALERSYILSSVYGKNDKSQPPLPKPSDPIKHSGRMLLLASVIVKSVESEHNYVDFYEILLFVHSFIS